MNISKTGVTVGTDQLHVVVNSSAMNPWPAHDAAAFGMRRVIGNQNTLIP